MTSKNLFADRGRCSAVLLWVTVAVALWLPAHVGLSWLEARFFDWQNLTSTTGVVGLLVASSWLAWRWRRSWVIAATLAIVTLFFVRMLLFGLVRFSGRDFDADFFVHLQLASVRVAWDQYRYLFVLFGAGVLVLIAVLALLAKRLWKPSARAAGVLASASLIAIAAGLAGMPEWHLMSAARNWFAPKQIALPNGRLEVWKKSPLVNLDLVSKQSLWAKAEQPPRNLIFLYIESGGLELMKSKRYPDLMPNMDRMVTEHGLVPYLSASSYVTIEGEANTQCGTLLPFEHGNDSMAGSTLA